MAIKDSYPINSSVNNLIYIFESKGIKGTIKKVVIFQKLEANRYNLAFGDEVKGKVDDTIDSNNKDMIKVLSTIANIIYDFTTHFPDAVIVISAAERRRLILYNGIFRKRFEEIEENFEVEAFKEGLREIYSPDEFYYKFEIKRKSSNLSK